MTLAHCLNKDLIENVVLKVSNEIERNNYSEKNWDTFSEKELFYELVACILGSRVRYETSKECVKRLRDVGLLNRDYLLRNPEIAKRKIFNELKKPIYPPFINNKGIRYPYAWSKAKFIVQTSFEIYYKQATTIKELLKICDDEFEARDKLVEICMGIGPKQASLFLRNVYYTEKLAILDSHVIQYMEIQGMVNGTKKSVATKNQYINYEKELISYANSLNKSMAKLDVAIWIVMRVAQKDFKWE